MLPFKKAFNEAKDILFLSSPIVVSQVGHVLMGFSDNVLVGRVGAEALAAAGVSNSVFFMAAVLGIGGQSLMAPMISKAKEEGQDLLCGRYLKAGLYVALFYSFLIILALSVCILFFDEFGQTLEVARLSKKYLAIITLSIPFMMLFIAIKQFSDGLGNTKIGMYVSVVGLLLNIALCYVFIYGMWGMPAMGLNGAGLATLLTRVLMTLGLYGYVVKTPIFAAQLKGYHVSFTQIRLEAIGLFKKGLPTGLQMLAECSAFSLAAIMVGWLGSDPLAAHQIVLSWANLSFMVASGVSVAVSIRVGAGLGAKSKERILLSAYTGFVMILVYELASFATFTLGKSELTALFTDDPNVLLHAEILMVLMGLFQIPDGVQVLWLGSLRGLLDIEIPTWITLFSYLAVCLSIAYVLGFMKGGGAEGVWWGLVIGLCTSAVLLGLRFHWYTRRLSF